MHDIPVHINSYDQLGKPYSIEYRNTENFRLYLSDKQKCSFAFAAGRLKCIL